MIETELDVVRDVSQRLESAGIAFMLTGSVAMNYYAQPRMTRDIDLVIALAGLEAESFAGLFASDYYVDSRAVAAAIKRRSTFNLIHNESIIKVDCIVLKDDEYRREEFARRKQIAIGDVQTWIVTREDLILSKLYWARESKSELQLRDVRNLLGAELDQVYLRSRAAGLGVDQLLNEVLELNG
jgi:predicted nucleotidyltransferase